MLKNQIEKKKTPYDCSLISTPTLSNNGHNIFSLDNLEAISISPKHYTNKIDLNGKTLS